MSMFSRKVPFGRRPFAVPHEFRTSQYRLSGSVSS
jgi:hypothetical protein